MEKENLTLLPKKRLEVPNRTAVGEGLRRWQSGKKRVGRGKKGTSCDWGKKIRVGDMRKKSVPGVSFHFSTGRKGGHVISARADKERRGPKYRGNSKGVASALRKGRERTHAGDSEWKRKKKEERDRSATKNNGEGKDI